MPATVTGGASGNVMTLFTLDKGSAHGVSRNMPVLTEDGIVGFVSEVGLNWCKVTTVIETASSVGACVLRSGDAGIVSGDFSLRKNGYCKFSYVEALPTFKLATPSSPAP